MFSLLALASLLLAATHAAEEGDFLLVRSALNDVLMPKAISDHTATLGSDNLIYLAGGCDDPNGNVYISDIDMFVCASVSNSMFSFNPQTMEFLTMEMPRPRYRHAAEALDNQIWLVGGRDAEDNLITEVDVYDISTKSWTTYTLPEEYATSDLGSFASDTHAYFVAGYNASYTAYPTVFTIDSTSAPTDGSQMLSVEVKTPLVSARGDLTATVDADKQYAYIAGGFTHENWCAPLGSVARYSLADNTWEELPSLQTPRSDKIIEILSDHLITMGGETQPENKCSANATAPEPGDMTVPVDDIEVLSPGASAWTVLSDLPDHLFRFAAVVYEDTIYAFGGQLQYVAECQCHPTSKLVATFKHAEATPMAESDGSDATTSTSSAPTGMGFSSWFFTLTIGYFLGMKA